MDYSYSYNAGGGAAAAFLIVMWIVMLAFAVLAIIGLWKTLNKAGLPGWAAIIPFYNEYNVVKLSNRPVYFFWIMLGCSLLAWIPFIGWLLIIGIFVLWIFMALDIAANFGQGTGFAILLIIFPSIMFLFLGFGGYEFRRIAAAGSAGFGSPPMPAGGGYAAAPPAPGEPMAPAHVPWQSVPPIPGPAPQAMTLPPAGQGYVPPTPGPAAQPMTPPPPLAQPLQPQPLSPPPAQPAPYTTPPAEGAAPTPPPAEPATPESPTPPPPPPVT